MIRRLDLHHFKGFEKFTITFPEDAIVVGPNNAGKSTVIAALRAAASMVRTAGRLRPHATHSVEGKERFGFNFSGPSVGLIEENLRFELHEAETRLRVRFNGDGLVEALWPTEDSGGFFYVMDNDLNPRMPKQVRRALPRIGLVPVISPADHVESLLSDTHVKENLDSRLASRHFRNQLYLLDGEYTPDGVSKLEDFKSFAQPWLPELELTDLRLQSGGKGATLDLFYLEPGSRNEKEIFWAGDGLQIWLQLLLHLYRLKSMDVVVLDEPDVFLHADLQRRLVRLLDELPCQTIMATHSAEVVSDAPPESVIWVSRARKRAVREPKRDSLVDLSLALGTHFNLRLARALKTRSVVFVEGEDLKVLNDLAKTLGLARLQRERGISVIPLGGFDRWEQVEPFKWLMSEFFEDTHVHVILDRDFRVEDGIERVRKQLRKAGISPHVWRRNELENYLLDPSAIARMSGASEPWVEQCLAECANSLEEEVYAQIQAEYTLFFRKQRKDQQWIYKAAKQRADSLWKDPSRRLHVCGGKEILRLLNARLQEAEHKTLRARTLSKGLRKQEIPDEVKSVLERIQESAAPN
ncbi:MAG TPA: AAA family ATPase [Solirubrobacterales bacterium]|nr:AAA family ATPase [Solirubrobacterales bacterium]